MLPPLAEDPAALRWVWESLWSERQTEARGDKFELAVPETVLFREGRATRWYFTSNAGTLLKRHGFRLAWPQIRSHFSKLGGRSRSAAEGGVPPAAIIRRVPPGGGAVITSTLTRRQLLELGERLAGGSWGQVVLLQSWVEPERGGRGCGVYVHRLTPDPGVSAQQLRDSEGAPRRWTHETRELLEWPPPAASSEGDSFGESRSVRVKSERHELLTLHAARLARQLALCGSGALDSIELEFVFDAASGLPVFLHARHVEPAVTNTFAPGCAPWQTPIALAAAKVEVSLALPPHAPKSPPAQALTQSAEARRAVLRRQEELARAPSARIESLFEVRTQPSALAQKGDEAMKKRRPLSAGARRERPENSGHARTQRVLEANVPSPGLHRAQSAPLEPLSEAPAPPPERDDGEPPREDEPPRTDEPAPARADEPAPERADDARRGKKARSERRRRKREERRAAARAGGEGLAAERVLMHAEHKPRTRWPLGGQRKISKFTVAGKSAAKLAHSWSALSADGILAHIPGELSRIEAAVSAARAGGQGAYEAAVDAVKAGEAADAAKATSKAVAPPACATGTSVAAAADENAPPLLSFAAARLAEKGESEVQRAHVPLARYLDAAGV